MFYIVVKIYLQWDLFVFPTGRKDLPVSVPQEMKGCPSHEQKDVSSVEFS
jgi:hypothetical protein